MSSSRKLRCQSCGRVCEMRVRGARPGAPVVTLVALHRCMKCSGAQVFTVRKEDGSEHRVGDDERPLSEAEILSAVRDFVGRGLAAQKSVEQMTERCRCGHMLAAHASHAGPCAACRCSCFRARPVRLVRGGDA